jgi:chaperone modulatory protein CbpM
MKLSESPTLDGRVVEDEVQLTLLELCQASGAPRERVMTWVSEGMLEPLGDRPPEWRFTGVSLRRTRLACRLEQDLELNPPGVALALDLMDEIMALKAELRRSGYR